MIIRFTREDIEKAVVAAVNEKFKGSRLCTNYGNTGVKILGDGGAANVVVDATLEAVPRITHKRKKK
jgi:hypothetical protein